MKTCFYKKSCREVEKKKIRVVWGFESTYITLFHTGFESDLLFTDLNLRVCCFEDFGASSCQRCSTGFYQDTFGQNGCKTCPTERTTLGLGAESFAECVCKAGFIEAWAMDVGALEAHKSPICR